MKIEAISKINILNIEPLNITAKLSNTIASGFGGVYRPGTAHVQNAAQERASSLSGLGQIFDNYAYYQREKIYQLPEEFCERNIKDSYCIEDIL